MNSKIIKKTFLSFFLVFTLVFLVTNIRATTYYSYQSGNWNGTNVWTTDSTGTTLIGSATPASNDIVYILSGRTILASANIATTSHTININAGAVFDMADRTIPAIILNGKGRFRTSRVSGGVAVLPTISSGTFLSSTGGTVEFYAATGNFYMDDNIATYYNLLVNLGSVSQVITVRRNLTIYGSMTVNQGTFQLNDATTVKRTITINGNLTVQSNAKITTGTGNTNTYGYSIASNNLPPGGQFHTFFHELSVGGDLTNNGTIRFTNLSAPNYGEFASNGAVTVYFKGWADNTMTLNGTTDFYNLIVDKGIDQNYTLTINSANVAYFALYGTNSVGRNEASPFTQDNPEVRKALWIKNGTLKFTGYILVPTLTEGHISDLDGNGDYAIGSNCQLWIAGPNVSVYSTASDNTGFPQAPVGAVGVQPPGTAHQAISIFGKLRISDGYLSSRHSAGIIFWNTANSNSAVIVEGGTVNVSVLRTTYTASGKTSYLQTGGTVIVRGDETEAGELNSSYPIFSIPNPSSSFVMSGGDIIIRDNSGASGGTGNGLYINCSAGNYSVTGGSITIETNPPNNPSTPITDINSKVNLWNLNIKRLGSSGNSVVNLLYDLTISNDLTVYSNGTLTSGSGNYKVSVSGNFTVNAGGTYTPNSNTTAFNGTGNYFLWNEGTITNGLYNLQVDKTEGALILVSSSSSFTVLNNLTISNGTLADGGNAVYVGGNVINNGTHIGAGKISLNKSTGTQTIAGNGLGTFQNLEINNTYGASGSSQVSLTANILVTGNLILANNRVFNIGTFKVTLGTLAAVQGTMSSSRFIGTSGIASDGGLSKIYVDTTAFIFPIGTGSNYTPVTIHLKKIPGTYGTVTVRPVPVRHPFATSTNCLTYYWKVEDSGFQDVQAGSVQLIFNYGNLTDNSAYVPGVYNPASWVYINDVNMVDETNNLILFNSQSSITGDYTAGNPSAFGLVTAFYSRGNGSWNSASTWSNAGFGGPASSTVPGVGNPVFIGDGINYFHSITVSGGSAFSGTLSLQQGSVLDIGTTSGHNFGFMIPGSQGKLRICANTATAIFPAGDFGNFLRTAGGIVEYYSGTVDFSLPVTSASPTSLPITNYCQLMLSPATANSITMPNSDLVIFGTMTVQGASATALAKLNANSAHNLILKANLAVTSGDLLFQNTMAQSVRIDSNLTIESGAIFNVANSGTVANNSLSIGGDLTNRGTFDMSQSSTLKCDVTFTGFTDALISGRGATTDFYSLTLNKGISANSVLSITSSSFSFSNNNTPLTLLNGTFRLVSALTVPVSVTSLNIPATTCLSVYGGTFTIATVANDTADVELAGMIEVKAGGITIGNSANNNNNDIEYVGAGLPTINVMGGSLFVNGQIRRSLINGLGSLVYSQSGASSVTINSRNAQPTRAKLEVMNTGSVFDMSGGTLTIVRGAAGSAFYDLFLRPSSSSVTGGTIIFGNSTTENTNNANIFTFDATVPLNNLTVDGTTTSKTVSLMVHDLTLKGNLLINATSVFNTDSLNIYIAGNFSNLNTDAGITLNTGGYRPLKAGQVTTFNGSSGNQTITGVSGNNTNFSNLVINNTATNGTVTLQANTVTRVNNDLTLTRGTLADGGNVINVIGNISNSSTHSGTGRITLAGSVVQLLSGNGLGKFGNMYLNNTYSVNMTASMEFTGVLTFQTKMLDIGSNLLKLSNTAAGAIAGSSSTSYIRTDGLLSDAGVQKSYATGATDFTFPIGVAGKYTPARENVTANTAAGTITVVNVNSKHPCTTDPGNYELKYYWHVSKTGFNAYTVSQYYTYVDADIQGTESNYIAARYYNAAWITTGGSMYTFTNQIRFLSAAFIDGDYTAGYASEFGALLTYYSRDATCTSPLVGNWDNVTTWSTVSPSGPAATTYPAGQPVIISTNHIVSTNGAGRQSFTLALNGTGILDLASTVGHNFGTVTGTGTIKLTPSTAGFFVFPSGNYTVFTSTAGGTVELNNTSGTAMFPYLTTYNKLTLKGAGTKQMTDADITVNGILNHQTGSTFVASANNSLILANNWINDGTFNHNNGSIVFNGNTTLSGASGPVLNNLTINSGKTFTGPLSSSFGVAGNFINNGIFNHNSGTVNFSGISTISGSAVTTFNNITIGSGKTLSGKLNDNIILLGNWVNNGNFVHNGGTLTFNGSTLVSGSAVTGFGYVVINNGYSLTGPASGLMNVAFDFTNDGTFNNNAGTLVFNGTMQGLNGSSPTLFENITVTATSNTSFNMPDQTLRGIVFCDGIMNANGNLTLLSDMNQTALIDGSGEGDVLGDLTMQRYLASGYGYKYFSSPFQAATVNEFSDDMDLYASFPTFYRYDENRSFTGWLNYTDPAGLLVPFQGYAVNFGPSHDPKTVNITGVANNRTTLPVTLFNSNRPFTQGFNLIGNPYPSPIDWDANVGWVRTNIDDALYYFDAGGADQYSGTYSTYINGISSNGFANNIIAAMQGFFIHVSNGEFPVAATLISTNDVRINNLSPYFHKKIAVETRPLLRMTASFAETESLADPAVIYFDNESTITFDKDRDALKLMNTDYRVPNFYTLPVLLSDTTRFSINGMPYPVDTTTMIPLGLRITKGGRIIFKARDMERIPSGLYIYISDTKSGACQDLALRPEFPVYLDAGNYEHRFYLILSLKDLRYKPGPDKKFHVYSSGNRVYAYLNIPEGEQADLRIWNMLGQQLYRENLSGNGYHEIDLHVSDGVYVVTLSSQKDKLSKKVFITNE